nr:polyprotein [Red mite iflavirus 1]
MTSFRSVPTVLGKYQAAKDRRERLEAQCLRDLANNEALVAQLEQLAREEPCITMASIDRRAGFYSRALKVKIFVDKMRKRLTWLSRPWKHERYFARLVRQGRKEWTAPEIPRSTNPFEQLTDYTPLPGFGECDWQTPLGCLASRRHHRATRKSRYISAGRAARAALNKERDEQRYLAAQIVPIQRIKLSWRDLVAAVGTLTPVPFVWCPRAHTITWGYVDPMSTRAENAARLTNIVRPIVESIPRWVPEMDAGTHGDQDVAVIQKSTTSVVETTVPSVGLHAPLPTTGWDTYCGTCRTVTAEDMDSREFVFKTIQWNTSKTANSTLADIELPNTVLDEYSEQPNFALFERHMYWKGDMIVSIKIDSNCRQYGQLQASWFYGHRVDKNFSLKNNVFTNSQAMHCLVTANASSPGVLYIPFRYVKQYLNLTRTKVGKESKCLEAILGKLRILVLVPLTVAAGNTAQNCNVSLTISFKNSCFNGVVARSVLYPEMFQAVIAAQALKMLGGDNNRDQPMHQQQPMNMKPMATDCWSAGTNMSRSSNPLRLDPTGLTPYTGDRAPLIDEMHIDYIKQVFGLLKIVQWTAQDITKKLLVTLPAEPLMDESYYYYQAYQGVSIYAVPPVGVVSSMFAFWRGEIELRFDIVGTADLSGKLMIAYVPGRKVSDYKKTMGSYVTYFDLAENRTLTWVIPFVSDKPWRHRRYTMGTSSITNPPPGYIYIYVVNPLIVNSTIPDNCRICIYIRGAPTFEVAVPTQSILGLAWNPTVRTGTGEKEYGFKTGYYPVYASSWRYFKDSKYNIMRYGGTTDHVAQLSDTAKSYSLHNIGYFQIKDPNPETCYVLGEAEVRILIDGFVAWNSGGYCYAIPVTGTAMATAIIKSKFKDDTQFLPYKGESGLFTTEGGSNYLTLEWEPLRVTGIQDRLVSSSSGDGFESLAPEMDERINSGGVTVRNDKPSASGVSIQTFGESFMDLKDLLRRPQLYYSYEGKASDAKSGLRRYSSLRLPVMAQGLELDIGPNDNPHCVWNFMREGHIALIGSAFRFYSGSLHFKIRIINSSETNKPTIFVQHRPNEIVTYDHGIMKMDKPCEISDLVFHTSALAIQDTQLNKFIEVDVPFYLAGSLAFAQRPDFTEVIERNTDLVHYMTMGELAVGTLDNSEVPAFDVYYSIGDDFRFSTFQGFPQVIFLNDPARFVPEMDYEDTPEMRIPFFSDVIQASQAVTQGVEKIARVTDRVDSLMGEMTTGETTQIVDETLKQAGDTVTGASWWSTIYTVVSSIVHCLLTPTYKNVSWAFVSLFGYLTGMVSFGFGDLLKKVQELFHNVTTKAKKLWKGDKFEPQMDEETAAAIDSDLQVNGDVDGPYTDAALQNESWIRKHITSIISVIISGVMAYLGYRSWRGDYDNRFIDLMYKIMRSFTMTANGLLAFFRSTADMFKSMFDWCMRKVCPSYDSLSFLEENDKDLYNWAKRVQILTDGRNRNAVLTNPRSVSELYATANEACLIRCKILKLDTKRINAPQLMMINSLIREIIKLRDFASGMHIAPPVKFEPFVLQFSGPPNIGKSFLLPDICTDMLEHVGYRTFCEPYFTRAPGNAYFNGLTNQPIIIYDDFLCITTEPHMSTQISELFQLKTRCVFNPPMAAVEDKCIRYNPIIVGLSSNSAFPQLPGVIDSEAVYRRRDLLVNVTLQPQYENIGKVSPEVMAKYGHLEFSIYNDSRYPDSLSERKYTYDEFKTVLLRVFQNYYHKETEKYRSVAAKLFRLAPKPGEEEFKFQHHTTGQALDKIFEARADMAPQDINIIKYISAETAQWAMYKKKHLEREITDMINDSEKTGKKKMFSDIWLEAYAKITRSNVCDVRQNISKHITTLNSLDLSNMELRKQFVKKWFAEGDQPTVIQDPSTSRPNPQGAMCIHQYLQENQLLDSSILGWDNENDKFVLDMECVSKKVERDLKELLGYWKESCPIRKVDKDYHIGITGCTGYKPWQCPVMNSGGLIDYIRCYVKNSNNLYQESLVDKSLLQGLVPDIYIQETPKQVDNPLVETTWVETLKSKLMPSSWSMVFKIIGGLIACLSALAAVWYMFKGKEEKTPEEVAVEEKVNDYVEVVQQQSRIIKLEEKLHEMEKPKIDLSKQVGIPPHIREHFEQIEKAKTIPQGEGSDKKDEEDERCERAKQEHLRQEIMDRAWGHGTKASKLWQSYEAKDYSLPPQGGTAWDWAAEMNAEQELYVTNTIKRNTLFIKTVFYDGRPVSTARCFALAGHWVMFPTHYMDLWLDINAKGQGEFYLSDSTLIKPIQIKLEELEFKVSEHFAIGFFKLPVRCRLYRNIMNNIVKSSDVCISKLTGILIETDCEKNTLKHGMEVVRHPPIVIEASGIFKSFFVSEVYRYGYGGKGVCGSILVDNRGRFIGMHVAGDGKRNNGLSQGFTLEDIERVLGQNFIVTDAFEANMTDDHPNYADVKLSGIAYAPRNMKNHQVRVTKYQKSFIHDDIEPIMGIPNKVEPAVLSSWDPRIKDSPFDPLVEGIKHHGDPMLPFDKREESVAIADLRALIMAKCKPFGDTRQITIEEAFVGDGRDSFIRALDWNTSVGWPLKTFDKKQAHRKDSWVTFENNLTKDKIVSVDEELLHMMKIKDEQRLAGIVPFTVFADTLKDETLPIEKARRRGGTRVISMSPLDMTVQQRQVTACFNSAYMRNWLDLEHAVSINPDSADWGKMFSVMGKIGSDNIICGDFSKFGDKLPTSFGHSILAIIALWYLKHSCESKLDQLKHAKRLKIMAYELFNAKHIAGREIYQVHGGQPSGNISTVIFNSMCNSLFMRVAWLSIMKKTPYAGLDMMRANYKFYTYGDDIIGVVSDRVKDYFNMRTLQWFFGKHNLKFTDVDKSGLVMAFRNWESASFLRRGFVPHPVAHYRSIGVLMAPADRDSIEQSLFWSTLRDKYAQADAMTGQAKLAFTRGEKYYKNFVRKVQELWNNYDCDYPMPDWHSFCERVYEHGDVVLPVLRFG